MSQTKNDEYLIIFLEGLLGKKPSFTIPELKMYIEDTVNKVNSNSGSKIKYDLIEPYDDASLTLIVYYGNREVYRKISIRMLEYSDTKRVIQRETESSIVNLIFME